MKNLNVEVGQVVFLDGQFYIGTAKTSEPDPILNIRFEILPNKMFQVILDGVKAHVSKYNFANAAGLPLGHRTIENFLLRDSGIHRWTTREECFLNRGLVTQEDREKASVDYGKFQKETADQVLRWNRKPVLKCK
jgi:hypothetical protein